MRAALRRPGIEQLVRFELAVALRGRAPFAGAAVFGTAAAAVALLGLTAFRQLGLGAVTPASVGLLEASILLPPLFAIMAGAAALHGEGESGLRMTLRAAGVPVASVLFAKMWVLAVSGGMIVVAGFGAAALTLSGSLAVQDLAPLVFLLMVSLLATTAAASIGLLISALTCDRGRAQVTALAAWALMAVGADLVLFAVAPLTDAGSALLATAVLDPLEAARIAGLLALGADAHVLGSVGAYVSATAGAESAAMLLMLLLGAWTALAFVAAWLVASGPPRRADPRRAV